MADVLETLIRASEKAACVARSCCTGTPNETLFISEKCGGEANARFDKDFKTIADVLAQESARSEIASRCPGLAKHVRGEECAEIGGVSIGLKDTAEQTAEVLSSLVPPQTAKRMAEAAHSDVNVILGEKLPKDLPNLNSADLGVWIDPIDATAEFIAGVKGEADADGGLPSVTVLIGAYERSTGEPIVGVINQPFYNNGKGRIIWGVSYGDTKVCGGCDMNKDLPSKTVLMSASESPEIREKFVKSGWEVQSVPGAGNKLMKVVLGEAAVYVVSKGTTFRWDTCAPHAILRAKGGDVLCYKTHNLIRYNDPLNAETQLYSNAGGIIAYSEPTLLEQIQNIIN